MDIVYRKTGFKREFSRFLMYKYTLKFDFEEIFNLTKPSEISSFLRWIHVSEADIVN